MIDVDAAQIDAVDQELKSTVKTMTQHHASGPCLTDHRVLFFDWNVLQDRERLEDISELERRRVFIV